MDLNLDNYSDIEIINLLHLPIKDNYTLPELKNNTLDHVKVILNTEDEMIGNKQIYCYLLQTDCYIFKMHL